MSTKQLYSANHFYRMSFGDFGFRVLSATGTTSTPNGERYCFIESLHNATTISFTNNTIGGDTTITDLTLKDFHTVRGDISDITISNGVCIAYLRN